MGKGFKKKIKKYSGVIFLDSIGLIKKCGLNLIVFELLYKLVAIAVLYPCFLLGFNFTLKKAGFRYLTNDYFFTYIRSPFTIIFFLLIIAIAAAYITYEVACLSVCFDAGYHGNPISISAIFKAGVRLIKNSISHKRINAVFHVVAVSLMMNITLLGFWLTNITLPDSAKSFLHQYYIIFIVAGVLLLAFFVYCMLHIFVMNYMAYDGEDITDSKRKSRLLIRHRGLKTFFSMFGWNALILVGLYLIYIILILIICLGVFILNKSNLGMAIYLSVFRVVLTIMKIFMIIISIPVSYGVITSLFYRYRCDSGNELNMGEITEAIQKKKNKYPKLQYYLSFLLIAVSLSVNIFYMVSAFDNNPFSKVEIFNDTATMAHRGCSYDAPENTMLAFEHAVEATADYIELDVHETADGEIIVMHDASLKRTTGVNKKIWDVTYEEIKDLDAGSYFGDNEEYADCRISTLREVMEYTKGKIKLNIEIKLSDNEPDLVSKVAALIEEYEYIDDCYVTSMNYEALRGIKMINPQIKTGYVLSVAYGNFYNLDYCDAFSINSAFVNKNVVDAIHNRGKKIFVWTVNSRAKAKELTTLGIDALISDNPVMSREVVYSKYSNTLITNVLSYVFDR